MSDSLAAECAALRQQRDTLEAERNELIGHTQRLARELAESRVHALRADEALLQRDVLERERDELKAHIHSLAESLQSRKRLLWADPGSFYSPIVDPADRHVLHRSSHPLPNPPFDEGAMLRLCARLSAHYPSIPFPEIKTPGRRYHFQNPAFSYADAIVLFGLLMEFKPGRLIEAGSGYSSCAAMDTNDEFFGGNIEMTFIDPFPQTLLALLDEDDPYRKCISASALQDVPDKTFQVLQANDILFIDTSHVAKTGSDVNDAIFRVFPLLAPGVLVHVHDIFDGFEYPERWITGENRSWNEAYLLRAFLEFNPIFEIIYFNDWLAKKHNGELRSQMPLCCSNTGGSMWLRKLK